MWQLVAKMDQIHGEKMEKLKKELDLAQEIYADREYLETVENTHLQDKIKSFQNMGLLQALKLMISSERT